MKIFDTTTYFEEDLMMDIRFNILDKYVDKFIVCEAKFTHSGQKKQIRFDSKKFTKFKNKIIHIVVDNDPINKNLKKENTNLRLNSIKRIEFQRNQILRGLKNANPNDFVIYSDNDEIPNLKNINFKSLKQKIIIFKQKLFYYKFNLQYQKMDWYGSKGCKVKDLINISWLRNIKNKIYKPYRLDTLFSNTRYTNVKMVSDGGWHFTNLKTPKQLLKKYLNDEMHSEFELNKFNLREIKDKINNQTVNYNHFSDSKTSVIDKNNNHFKLKKINLNSLPNYIKNNSKRLQKWFV